MGDSALSSTMYLHLPNSSSNFYVFWFSRCLPLVVRPGAPSGVLAPSSMARMPLVAPSS